MKLKRLLVLIVVITVIGGISVFADDGFDTFKGKTVKIFVNDREASSNGLLVADKNGLTKSMVPVRDIADALQALVEYDEATQSINVYKPNVQMSVMYMAKDSVQFLGDVTRGQKLTMYILTWIDSVKTNLSALKVTVEDPYGGEIFSDVKEVNEQSDDHFWWGSKKMPVEFKYSGPYVVKLYMKDSNSDYTLVSQRIIKSVAKD
ncbi:MAG TPA: stalk domain-containing protein [Bacilli bacterium]